MFGRFFKKQNQNGIIGKAFLKRNLADGYSDDEEETSYTEISHPDHSHLEYSQHNTSDCEDCFPILKLPRDVIVKFLNFLDPADRVNVICSCRRLAELAITMSNFAPFKNGSKGLIWAIRNKDFDYYDHYKGVAGNLFNPNDVLKALCLIRDEMRILELFEEPDFDCTLGDNYLLRWSVGNSPQSFVLVLANRGFFSVVCLCFSCSCHPCFGIGFFRFD